MTTTDPFDPDYLDELVLRRDLSACFGALPAEEWPNLAADLAAELAATVDGRPESLTPAAQDRVIDAWSTELRSGPSEPGPVESGLIRRALQVRVRTEGLTPRLWIDRTFAGRRSAWCRAMVGYLGTTAGRGRCRCLSFPIVAGWQCCGSPWLDNGDLERFIRRARRNVALLAELVADGPVAPLADPVCHSIITQDYPAYVGGPATALVAAAYREAGLI